MEFKVTEEMIRNSLVSRGDVSRIIDVLNKAKSGQDITVAFLGGSITQGCNSTSFERCYASRTYGWFKNKFNNINVKYINAGVGATGSIIGVHRVERHVLSHNPDIIFIDFAVNDKDTVYDKIAYESLIRRILSVKNQPAIIEVFMSNFDGSNVQNQQIEIGKKYNIPMISFRNTIYNEMINNNLKWSEVATDEVHPNDYGHFIIAQLLINFIEDIYKSLSDAEVNKIELGKPLFGDKYISGIIMNNDNLDVEDIEGFVLDNEGFQVFDKGWRFESNCGGTASLVLNVEGENIFLLFKKSVNKNSGKLYIKVDENKAMLLDTYFKDGWGDYSETKVLVNGNVKSKHKIEITVVDEGRPVEVSILGVLVS